MSLNMSLNTSLNTSLIELLSAAHPPLLPQGFVLDGASITSKGPVINYGEGEGLENWKGER